MCHAGSGEGGGDVSGCCIRKDIEEHCCTDCCTWAGQGVFFGGGGKVEVCFVGVGSLHRGGGVRGGGVAPPHIPSHQPNLHAHTPTPTSPTHPYTRNPTEPPPHTHSRQHLVYQLLVPSPLGTATYLSQHPPLKTFVHSLILCFEGLMR